MSTFQLFEHRLRQKTADDSGFSFFTFNHNGLTDASRIAPHPLMQIQDVYLDAKSSKTFNEAHSTVLLPLEGQFRCNSEQELFPGELTIFPPINGTLTNSGDGTGRIFLLNFALDLSLTTHSFDPGLRNQLQTLYAHSAFSIAFGVFDGRTKFENNSSFSNTFVQNVNGAFEVEDRLLEVNDGLLIRNQSAFEAEALSENAICLVLSF